MHENGLAIGWLISGPHFGEEAERELIQRAAGRDGDATGTARQIMAISASPGRTAGLRKVTAPTLVIHGLADPLVPPSGGIATAQAVANSRLLMIPDMGHDRPRQRWGEIIDEIIANGENGPSCIWLLADPRVDDGWDRTDAS